MTLTTSALAVVVRSDFEIAQVPRYLQITIYCCPQPNDRLGAALSSKLPSTVRK
jgi:hypothetical protein